MLDYYSLLTEKCSYQKLKNIDEYNQKTHHEIIELDCFTSFDFSNDKNLVSQDVKLTKKIFIRNTFEPNPMDKVDGMEIQVIKPVKSLVYGVVGWEIIV